MSLRIVSEAIELAERMADAYDTYATINLVGGEPTLDMDKFAEIAQHVSRCAKRIASVHSTTNGWWLAETKNVVAYAKAVRPLIQKKCFDVYFRISNDVFHDKFRKGSESYLSLFSTVPVAPYYRPDNRLNEYLEDLVQETLYGEEDVTSVLTEKDASAIYKLIRSKTLYIDSSVKPYGDQKVSQVGRALKNGIGYQPGTCLNSVDFDVAPNGTIRGFCCLASVINAATTKSDPKALFELRQSFLDFLSANIAIARSPLNDNRGPDCADCPRIIREWKCAEGIR